jgi:hypothetical protein
MKRNLLLVLSLCVALLATSIPDGCASCNLGGV